MDIKSEMLRRVLAKPFGWDVSPQNLLADSSHKDDGDSAIMVTDEELVKRAGRRLVAEEISKQKNLEDVIEKADEILQSDHEAIASQEEADQGWVNECLDGAGKAYNNDLKAYWAKLLAGEIKHPGYYSLRVVDFMKKISKKDAERIREMCRYVLYTFDQNDAIILRYKESSCKYTDLSFLMELGLINFSNFVVRQYRFDDENGGLAFCFHKEVGLVISIAKRNFDLPIYSFTQLGKEVLSIIDDQEADVDYLRAFAKIMVEKNGVSEISGGYFELVGDMVHIKDDGKGFTFPEKNNDDGNKP